MLLNPAEQTAEIRHSMLTCSLEGRSYGFEWYHELPVQQFLATKNRGNLPSIIGICQITLFCS